MSQGQGGKSRKLGKGLSALMQPSVPVVVPTAAVAELPQLEASPKAEPAASGLEMIPLTSLVASPFQPRVVFDEVELNQLAQSIRTAGVIQPILVRRLPHIPNRFELVAGERRWMAAKLVGLEAIPALVRDLSDQQAAEMALVENLQRKDLDPMERAHALRRLNGEFGIGHAELAERIGLERSSVVNLIRVTELEDSVQGMIARGELTIGHGKVLLGFAAGEKRVRIATKSAREGWSVRELERRISDGEAGVGGSLGSQEARNSPTLTDLERRLGEHLGTRVRIATAKSGTKGRVMIEFYSLDHFDGLMGKMGFRGEE
jgi:ParB family chromosome partitioning protein